jgi:predicted phosphoadenosine phosphosulfate sulfurtransferase
MVKVKHYTDEDVLTAARKRILHIHELHDTVAVAFSGGKDSLVVLCLAIEAARILGKLPVRVIFRDEELIPDQVLDFVREWMLRTDEVDLAWWAVSMRSSKYILGTSRELILWDKDRRWLRQKPPWAITSAPGITDGVPADQYTLDDVTAAGMPGRVAVMTGIRAAESIMRFRASVNKLNDNYINATKSQRIFLCKPIYDWQEDDVFMYFYENKIKYCELYDSKNVAGNALRVSTPLHAEHAKHIGNLRTVSPVFYQQIMDLFPEMLVQERYYGDLDHAVVREKYGQSLDGIRTWIEENVMEEKAQAMALDRLKGISIRHRSNPESYPLHAILRYFQGGAFKRELLPTARPKK